MAKYILAIDQGTTGSTANLLNAQGRSVMQASQDFRQMYPQPGWVEHRPEDIWESVQAVVKTCLRKAKVKGTQLAAIGITNQRETVLVWDRKTGKASGNAIVWQDRRTSEFCGELKSRALEAEVQKLTGLVLDPYFSASKIRWILENGARAKAEKGELIAGNMDTFLLWRLSGGKSFCTDVSNASRTQLMDLSTQKWSPRLASIFSVPLAMLPEIRPSSGVFGYTKGLKFLPDGIPISGIAGDQQAALFGQTCFTPGESKCTYGTGSFLLMNTGERITRSRSGLLTTVAWQLEGERTQFALEGGAFICGAAVQFLRDQLRFFKSSAEIERLARKVKDTAGVEFVPALTGLGAPHWRPDARGVICGLTRGTQVEHIARATLEAMALQNVDILRAMQKDLGENILSVRVDGGASANNLLMQMQADFLGVEVMRPKMLETTSAGAGYLAGLGVGFWKNKSEIAKIAKIDKVFKPTINSSAREARLKLWHHAVAKA